MKTAMIILNYNNYEQTIECVNNLTRISLKEDIYVVDNCSTNDSYEILKNTFKNKNNVYVYKSQKNGGYSYGNNYGIYLAESKNEYDYFCIMNPDVILETDYIEELCKKLNDLDDYAVVSALMIYPDKIDLTKISWDMRTPKQIYKQHFLLNHDADKIFRQTYKYIGGGYIEVDAVPGSFFIIKRKALHDIGYFDEGCFLYNEEDMLAISIKKIGMKMMLSLNHYYIHNHIYRKSDDSVWNNYKYNFDKVLNSYKITYNSRLYLCKNYYDGKYELRLKFVKLLNIFLLYCKHWIAVFFH